jgi:hypothetical protein
MPIQTPISKVKTILGYKARSRLTTMLKDATRLKYISDSAKTPSSTLEIRKLVKDLSALTPSEIRKAVKRSETKRKVDAATEARLRGTQERVNRSVAKEVRRLMTSPVPASPPVEFKFKVSSITQVVDVIRRLYNGFILNKALIIGARKAQETGDQYDMWASLSPAFTKALYESADALMGNRGKAEQERLQAAMGRFFSGDTSGQQYQGGVYTYYGGESDEDTQFVLEESLVYDVVIIDLGGRQAQERRAQPNWSRPSGEFFPYNIDATKFGGFFTPFTEDLARFGIYPNFTDAASEFEAFLIKRRQST